MAFSGKILLSSLTLVAALGVASTPLMAASSDDSKVHETSEEASRVISDSWITTKVKSELATTKGVSSHDISVKTKQGEVFLTGVLDNKEAVKKVVSVTKSVKGVKNVDDAGLKVDK